MSVDEAKWLEISSKFLKPEQMGSNYGNGSKNCGTTDPGSRQSRGLRTEGSNENTSEATGSLEQRIYKIEAELLEKTKVIESQRAIIARLNQSLVAATTKSIEDSYDVKNSPNDVEKFQCEDSQSSFHTPKAATACHEINEPSGDSGIAQTEQKGGNGGRKSQEQRLSLKSEGNRIKRSDNQPQDPLNLQIVERLDYLTQRIDRLELQLPHKIQSICAELVKRQAMTADRRNEDGMTSCLGYSMRMSDEGHLGLLNPFHRLDHEYQVSCHCPKKGNNCTCKESVDKQSFKLPAITPKSNTSAQFRLKHTLQQQRLKGRDKQDGGSEPSGTFSLFTIEDKLANIENVVSRFKEYLFKVLYNKLQL